MSKTKAHMTNKVTKNEKQTLVIQVLSLRDCDCPKQMQGKSSAIPFTLMFFLIFKTQFHCMSDMAIKTTLAW